MNAIAQLLGRSGLLKIDYHLLRAAMVIIFAWFGVRQMVRNRRSEDCCP